jgi:hypothetical protein
MSEPPGRGEIVRAWHADVHEHEVGRAAVGERDGLDAVCRLADDLDTGRVEPTTKMRSS